MRPTKFIWDIHNLVGPVWILINKKKCVKKYVLKCVLIAFLLTEKYIKTHIKTRLQLLFQSKFSLGDVLIYSFFSRGYHLLWFIILKVGHMCLGWFLSFKSKALFSIFQHCLLFIIFVQTTLPFINLEYNLIRFPSIFV